MKKIIVLSIVTLLALAGCSKPVEDKQSLKIGVMPAVDSLPIFVADQMGIFKELGLEIEVEIYMNAMDRQSALQSGELDGAMTDVIALVNNVQNGFDIKVTTSTDGIFPLLHKKDALDKEILKAGMMEVSVTNYLSDEFLKGKAFSKEYITDLPARLEMVGNGTLDVAVIPEPMASMGALNGLEKTLVTFHDEFSPEIMVFNQTAIDKKTQSLQLFHEGYNLALAKIKEDPKTARELLVATLKLKPEITDSFVLPEYHEVRVPSEDYLNKIIKWNNDVLKTNISLEYEDLVEDRFIK